MVSKICKRCGQSARLDDPFYRGFGAISRTDNKTMICSQCGVEEAMDDFRGIRLVPKEFWPIDED